VIVNEATKPRRNCGLILTLAGLQNFRIPDVSSKFRKILEAGTLEELSERTGHPRTVKILAREEGVDKRTIDYFFRAFNLKLDTSDYSKPDCNFEEIECKPYHTPTFEVRQLMYQFSTDV